MNLKDAKFHASFLFYLKYGASLVFKGVKLMVKVKEVIF